MPVAIQIAAKVVGQKMPLFTGWRIPIPTDDGGGGLTLRDLISAIVVGEVEGFRERQEARRLAQVLTPQQIADGAVRGKIDSGERDLQQNVNEDTAVGTALQAFEDGLYYVFIDDVQQTALEQQVFVGEDSRVMFVRLVALAGG